MSAEKRIQQTRLPGQEQYRHFASRHPATMRYSGTRTFNPIPTTLYIGAPTVICEGILLLNGSVRLRNATAHANG